MSLVIGIDFGTDSVRALIVNAYTGDICGEEVIYYTRWKSKQYCNAAHNQFRQHALDYLESMEAALKAALSQLSPEMKTLVKAISVDTTGSTIAAVDKQGTPLCLLPEYEHNANAMFILWKDHTAIAEAEEINHTAATWGGTDYTGYVGGVYSSEWFWAKILHTLRHDDTVRQSAYSWVEHCDWISAELTGNTNPLTLKRSRCAAGHKAMWRSEWGGLPSDTFLTTIDPLLSGIHTRLYTNTYTSNEVMGTLSDKWAQKLGLNTSVIIGVGAFDAHMGAVGGGCSPRMFTRIIGTSTCDIMVVPYHEADKKLIKGICGQVDGSVIPGMIGLEAGQSAFGDVFAWYTDMLNTPHIQIIQNNNSLSSDTKASIINELKNSMIPHLSEKASLLPTETNELSIDWMNGRRTPYANQNLKGVIANLNLGSDAGMIFKSLVEATAFSSKKIVDCFITQGIAIEGIIALGGIPQKSPYIMQTLANVLDMPIRVSASSQACALGAAMFAATACGIYSDITGAQIAMGAGYLSEYMPDVNTKKYYNEKYQKFSDLAQFIESKTIKA
ncbi:MAG: ribulokinase [Cytophagales bacterium]|nr:ribulokinase [Cytophagales bacterium]